MQPFVSSRRVLSHTHFLAIKMHVTTPDIEFLVNFLNCDVEKIRKRSTILTDPWPHWPTEKVRKTQADVCFALTEIIALICLSLVRETELCAGEDRCKV